jgi:flagellar basal body-associated protein FliL
VDSIIEDQEEDLTDEQLTEDGPPLVENAQTFSLGEMNLNLENPGAYLSVEVYLAYDGNQQNLRYELDKRSYHITSIVRHILESNTSQDIDSVNERNNILKPKIKNRVNEILQNGQVYSVYFKTFTIQYSPVS